MSEFVKCECGKEVPVEFATLEQDGAWICPDCVMNEINSTVAFGFNKTASQIYENNKAKGFWDNERNVGELLMLVTSELGEALEAHRKNKFAKTEQYDLLVSEGYTWEDSQRSYEATFSFTMKDTFEDEIADAIIRLLDMSAGLNIDIEKHIRAKLEYNKHRPMLHGKSY